MPSLYLRNAEVLILLVSLTLKTCLKIIFSKQADCSLTTVAFGVQKVLGTFEKLTLVP